jgi:hypothetical protein
LRGDATDKNFGELNKTFQILSKQASSTIPLAFLKLRLTLYAHSLFFRWFDNSLRNIRNQLDFDLINKHFLGPDFEIGLRYVFPTSFNDDVDLWMRYSEANLLINFF